MVSLPIEYLHLETGVLLIFIVMMLWTQLQRASALGPYTQSGKTQATFLLGVFGLFCLVFAGLLYRVSPLLAVELAAGFTLALMHPANALCLFVHMLYLRPWEMATDNAVLLALPRILAGLCFISWLIHPSTHAKPTAWAYRTLAVVLAFSGWLFLSTFFTPHIAENQSDWFDSFSKSIVVLGMCLYFLESERSIGEFENTIVLSSLGLMVIGFCRYRMAGGVPGRLEAVGMLGNANDLSAMVVMALPFALIFVFKKGANLIQQVTAILFAAFSALVVWYTASRGALVALFVQLFTTRLAKTERQNRLTLVVAAVVLGITGSLFLKSIHREQSEMVITQESRIIYWKAAIKMALHHPLFGVGYNQYPVNYDSYSSDAKFEWGQRTCHSSWFLALSESGFPGGILFTSFFVAVLFAAWKNRKRWPGQLYSVAGYYVTMSFLSHAYLIYPYLLAGLVIATHSLAEQSSHGH